MNHTTAIPTVQDPSKFDSICDGFEESFIVNDENQETDVTESIAVTKANPIPNGSFKIKTNKNDPKYSIF